MWIAKFKTLLVFVFLVGLTSGLAFQRRVSEIKPEQQIPTAKPEQQPGTETKSETPSPAMKVENRNYVLGPDDDITIQALDAEEITKAPVRIDTSGNINLPLIGRMRAAGLTIEQLEHEIEARLRVYIQQPQVAITVTNFRSQPVSVLGSVRNPGIHQLQGRKTLFEILSMAGGLAADAGHSVKITRQAEWGPIPLASAKTDATGKFSIAEVKLRAIMEARNPEENILIQPHDILSVPRAELVYVVGQVQKPGGFVLNDRENISILQALAMADGLTNTSSAKNARIIRSTAGENRVEIPVDVKSILDGKTSDVALKSDDILFIPNNVAKGVIMNTMQTAISIATSALIYGGYR
jgi:polysaccharide biosynthesis/export protein